MVLRMLALNSTVKIPVEKRVLEFIALALGEQVELVEQSQTYTTFEWRTMPQIADTSEELWEIEEPELLHEWRGMQYKISYPISLMEQVVVMPVPSVTIWQEPSRLWHVFRPSLWLAIFVTFALLAVLAGVFGYVRRSHFVDEKRNLSAWRWMANCLAQKSTENANQKNYVYMFLVTSALFSVGFVASRIISEPLSSLALYQNVLLVTLLSPTHRIKTITFTEIVQMLESNSVVLDLGEPSSVFAEYILEPTTSDDRRLLEATRNNPPIFSEVLQLQGKTVPTKPPTIRLETNWRAMQQMYQANECDYDIIRIDTPKQFFLGYMFVLNNNSDRGDRLLERFNKAILRHEAVVQMLIEQHRTTVSNWYETCRRRRLLSSQKQPGESLGVLTLIGCALVWLVGCAAGGAALLAERICNPRHSNRLINQPPVIEWPFISR